MQLKRAGARWNLSWVIITLTLWNWRGALGLNHCFQWQLVIVIIWTLSSLGLFVNASVTENSALPCPAPACQTDRQTAPAPAACPALAALAGPCPCPCLSDRLPLPLPLPCPGRPALPCPCPVSLNRQTPHFLRPETKRYGFFLGYGFQDLDRQTL
jgi:hypothetical protein